MSINRRLHNRLLQISGRWAALVRDRRGATALVFAVSAMVFLGIAGLATKGGTWYLEKRHGQNVADSAAIAGVMQIAAVNAGESAASVSAAGTTLATNNGYTAGRAGGAVTAVTVAPGVYTQSTNSFSSGAVPYNAVQATITRSPTPLFGGVSLLGARSPSIAETAIAAFILNPSGMSCDLALSGGITFKGNETVTANQCALTSDATGADAIEFKGASAQVTPPGSLYAAGGCDSNGDADQCALANVGLPCVQDPFGSPSCPGDAAGGNGIYALTMPPGAASAATCQNMPAFVAGTNQISAAYAFSAANQKMFCDATFGKTKYTGDLSISGAGVIVNLAPGTYVFYNASISLTGGTLECTSCTPGGAGVTIILTGSPAAKIGTISVSGNANVTLNAPAVNAWNSLFDGVLFYMDKNAPDNNGVGNAPVSFQGNGTVQLTGGMYFPSVTVSDNGNITSSAHCSELVAKAILFSGNSTQDVSGCSGVGTPVPQTYYVALVQ